MEAHDVSEIDPLVKAAQSPGAPLVSSVNKVLHALQERQYLRHMVIEPQFIGIHPQNRDGHGVAWHDCHSLMANIVDVGFDASITNCICVETAPGDSSAIAFNQALSVESGGKLPEVHPQHLKFLSLSGSHLNTALRMIGQGTPCSVESVAIDGKVNVQKVLQKDAAYAEASRAGLRWKVLSAAVLAQWPQLASLIQSAANTGNHLAREEHEAFGGGQKLIDRTSALVKTSTSGTDRSLGVEFYELLGQEPRPKDADPFVRFRHALLALGYSCPVPRLITATDCRRLFQRQFQDDIGKANELMGKVDALVEKKVEHRQRHRVFPEQYLFECQLVLLALQKRHRDIELCDSMEHAALAFCEAVQEAVGVTLSNEWDGLKTPPKSSALTTTAVAAKLREFDASGQVVARKKDKLQAKLVKFEGGNVVIEYDGEQYMATISAFLENQWKLIDEPKTREALDHVAFASCNSYDMIVAGTKGKIVEKLMELEKQHKASLNKVQVYLKPPKTVEATSEVAVGKLVLVPATPAIQALQVDSRSKPKGLSLGKCGTNSHSFYLTQVVQVPKDGKGIVVPFWFVKGTSDPDKANVEIVNIVDPGDENKGLKHIPLMKNTRALQQGDVLLKFDEARNDDTPDELVPFASAVKRRKTGKKPE
ncbi:unnamed protein product [Durusdinium trenchii]|uniref:Uncharacterized protein n=1 Tax=Durusdinium trenchii TaxID=1381693 RepID=A0ABP0P300_9DINO